SPEGIERPSAERIDEQQALPRCNLDQAEPGMIALFADEFRVETEHWTRGEVGTAVSQLVGVRDNLFGKVRHARPSWVEKPRRFSLFYGSVPEQGDYTIGPCAIPLLTWDT